jgi:hypothetical protein
MVQTVCFREDDMLLVNLMSASKGCFPLCILLSAMFTSLSGLMIRKNRRSKYKELKEQM